MFTPQKSPRQPINSDRFYNKQDKSYKSGIQGFSKIII